MILNRKRQLPSLLFGLVIGIVLSRFVKLELNLRHNDSSSLSKADFLVAQSTDSKPMKPVDLTPNQTNLKENVVTDTSVTDRLFNQVRIVCLVMTRPDTHETRAWHVLNTWGKHCHKLVFMSTRNATSNGTLEVVALPVDDGRNTLIQKAREMFKYAYRNLLDEGDWFYKADDDT